MIRRALTAAFDEDFPVKTRLAAAAPLLLAASLAQAGLPFDQIIVFGASFDDSGQFPDPASGFSTGLRFTNVDPATGRRGASLPEWLARDIGLGPLTPTAPLVIVPRTDAVDSDNLNFAVGGYRAEQVLASVVGTQTLQVGPFSSSGPGYLQRLQAGTLQVGPDTLYYALPAGNDIRDVDDPVLTAGISLQIVDALVGSGARYIVLPTLPKLGEFAERANYTATGRTPLGEARTAAAIAYNEAFVGGLAAREGNFILVDAAGLSEEIIANPGAFGFATDLDLTRTCFDAAAPGGPPCDEPAGRGKSSGGDPAQFIFYDGLHPTQGSARIAADLIESVLRAPGIFSMLPEATLADARAHRNAIDQQLARTRWAASGEGLQLFASVQGHSLEIAEARSTPALDSDTTDLTIGLSLGIDERFAVGLAIASQSSEQELDEASAGFDTDGLAASVFGTWRQGIWFADAVLSAGQGDIEDVERVFSLGTTAVRRERGDTESTFTGAAARIGVDMLPAGSAWRFGPMLGLDYLEVDVDGYVEEGVSASALRVDDQQRQSLQGRAGVFASYPFRLGGAELELRADVARVEEFEDETDELRAAAKSIPGAPWFRMPGYALEQAGWRIDLGLDARWDNGLSAGLSWRRDDNDAEADYLEFGLRYRLP